MTKTAEKILRAIEKLEGEGRDRWNRCQVREIDIGYAGDHAVPFSSIGLTSEVLGRIADTGATLKFTVLPMTLQVHFPCGET